MKAAQESQSLLSAETEEDTTKNKETGHEKTDHIEDKLSSARGTCSFMILCAFTPRRKFTSFCLKRECQ